MKVYKSINAVQSALSKTGITKDRTNTQGASYKFRGIDDVYNAIAPLLSEYSLCILPRVLTRICNERTAKSGSALFYVTVEAEFDFVSSEDGSKHTVKTFGEAMDSGDKATNKAMSAAYKYACFQAFSIPTESDNDADSSTHEVKPKSEEKKPEQRLPKLPDEEAEKAYNSWLEQKIKMAEQNEDGYIDPEVLNTAWFNLPSNYRTAITTWGNKLKQDIELSGKKHIESIKNE